ncbi:MAG: gamma-glutamylcyclotransferase [Lachnospiraceae bacterium]|nr:gamma-glutamylcyclotransferase [Lachnospiraceae bacterium]
MANIILTSKLNNRNNALEINRETEAFVFVYGTLLKGKGNYNHFLAPADPVMRGEIDGFVMYELGSFPGIVKGEGKVKGEVYKVSKDQLSRIDQLEGEGSLYLRETAVVEDDCFNRVEAYVYVYNHDVSGSDLIPYEAQPYKNEYVWYVAYGSNMLYERLSCYIEGDYCERNGREYRPCADTTMPTEWMEVELPYNMYFANYNQGAWEKSAVSFLDVNHFGYCIARAYLIKECQLDHIHSAEGRSANWYPDVFELGEIQGIRAVTFTNKNTKPICPMSEVSMAYASTIIEGIMEMGESAAFAYDYVKGCTSPIADVCYIRADADHQNKYYSAHWPRS